MKQIQAKWIYKNDNSNLFKCSYCGYQVWYWEANTNICPGCRAKMIGYEIEDKENKDK